MPPSPFNMVTRLFQLLLLLSPICIGANVNMDMFDIIFFRTGIITLFTASLFDKPKRELSIPIRNSMAGLIILVIINTFIHTFAPVVMACMMNLSLGMLGIYIIYIYYDETKDIRKYILWAAAINLAFFIIQQIGFDPVFDKKTYIGEEGAFFASKSRMMTYFALVVPFLYTPLLIIGLVLGLFTKQYVILIPITLMLYSKARNGKERIGVLVLTLLTMALLRKHLWNSMVYRFNIAWKPALNLYFDRPLIGYGLGNRVIPELEVLGSSLLQFIIGVGITGIAWIGYMVKKFDIRDSGILTLLAVICVEYPIEIPRLWFLIIAIVVTFFLNLVKIP